MGGPPSGTVAPTKVGELSALSQHGAATHNKIKK
jgi:hypothetical protein